MVTLLLVHTYSHCTLLTEGSPECLCCGPCRFIRIGDKECEFNKNFRLILHTKLANPHYKPELQAQTTLLNFTVTEDGLEGRELNQKVGLTQKNAENLKKLLGVSEEKRGGGGRRNSRFSSQEEEEKYLG